MKKALYLIPVGMLFICASVHAQRANIDSLALVAQISQDQLKLGKLQNMVDQKTRNMQTAQLDAQHSAGDNVKAAERLNDDPNNKKLASDANSKAGDAKSDARKSRKETRRMDDLNKSIIDLQNKISVAQGKLVAYTRAPLYTPVSMPISRPDTAQHP